MSSTTAILLTGVLVASACALLGNFLILRRMAMMSDAISHAILPGLVAGYFLAHGPNLLVGFLGAAAAAAVTVFLVEALQKTRRVDGGSAMGIVFPAMFALGVVLVSKFFADVHLDTDAILYGNIEFSAFDILYLGDRELGPQSLWVMGALCALNLSFLGLFYKELKLTTFDPGLAAALGFSPLLMHYATMTVLSITTVGAFTAVGAILVVALVIVPAATAYLLTDRLAVMIGLSVAIGAVAAVAGYFVAVALDASIAGAMVTMTGVLFAAALLFSPSQGLIAKARRTRRNRARFAAEMLVVHLFTHEGSAAQAAESLVAHLSDELRWSVETARQTVARALDQGLVSQAGERLALTDDGRQTARQVLAR
ncbi:MAG: Mn-Zn_transporter_SitD [uncultured Thermomicrobiales bacterium]|uniref:Mn-Zn_transporter_SitD n=1 Tax=uncultured Thermomicrobiales bacterium TaxID=1645740 RepID=A0A6J4VM87_9BACT|nr:MAG: Mn-Zn_transporter_SitD [uncultured Thermomicrobiales bacterium]